MWYVMLTTLLWDVQHKQQAVTTCDLTLTIPKGGSFSPLTSTRGVHCLVSGDSICVMIHRTRFNSIPLYIPILNYETIIEIFLMTLETPNQ